MMDNNPSRAADRQPAVRITDSGLGTTYRPGDIARGYIVVTNAGKSTIGQISVKVTIYPGRMFGLSAGHKTETFNVRLQPGESTRLEYTQTIPSSVMGISTKGHYRLEAGISADGIHVATLRKSVDVI